MAFLEVKNVYKAFGKKEVLKGASFTLGKGEVLAIIGSSGNGKSTLLRILNSLEFADQGEVWLNGELLIEGGKPVKEKELRAKRKHFGMVFQSFHLFPQYNALNNVALAPTILAKEEAKKLPWKERKAARAKARENALTLANELLDRVGLSDKKENYPCELSGGQCQRVAIARALALSPDILCFDEPTSALDPELTGEVLKVIRGLKHADRTMILVTHEMQFAKSVADKVLFMANGIAEEFGTPEEVFENPKSELTKAFLAGYSEE
ncbi:MAG: amino acid ABC transporter ATP-binding protein [Clostridiales bacterium]|nr:amino acid ABC transporter ATP-binding protein [Clostridiales bacterium]